MSSEKTSPPAEREEEININWKDLSNNKYFWPAVITISFLALTLPLINAYKTFWWDESEYLLIIKHLFLNTPLTGWGGVRSMIHLGIMYLLTLPFGYNELALKIVNLMFALGFVVSSYYFFKELLTKEKAVMAGLIMAVSWVILFWALRINSDMANGLFLTLSAVFYIKALKNNKGNNALLSGVFLGIALTMRFTGIVSVAVYIIHSIITKKEKKHYMWLIGLLIGYAPLAIYDMIVYQNPLQTMITFAQGSGVSKTLDMGLIASNAAYYLTSPLSNFGILMGVLVFIGLIPSIFKIKDEKISFILLNIALYMIFYIVIGTISDLRFLIHLTPFLTLLFMLGAMFGLSIIKLNKRQTTLVLAIITAIIVIDNLNTGITNVQRVSNSYIEVKNAGEFLKQYPGNFKIMSQSVPQNTYYSEKETYRFPNNETQFVQDVGNYTFMIVSLFEQHPEYAYALNYSFLVPIKAYPTPQEPKLMIYLVNKTV